MRKHRNSSFLWRSACVLAAVIFYSNTLRAQQADSVSRLNTIKADITSHWLYRNAFVLSYERQIKHNRSLAVTAGFQQFPTMASLGDGIDVTRERNSTGFKAGAEYRFYLSKENKFAAPHGIYMGPYISYLNFNVDRNIMVESEGVTQEAAMNSKLNIFNIGYQLGYQFVINNRWTIDLVFLGPSISNYSLKMKLDGNYNFSTEDIENEALKAFVDRFPLIRDLINNKEVSAKGSADTWAYGFRYQLLVGYHFGRKKN